MRIILPLLLTLAASAAFAKPVEMKILVEGIEAGKPVPAKQALCTPTADGKSEMVKRLTRPTITWDAAPEGTESFAVFMMDPDVPADFTNAGKEGKTLPAKMKRQDFFHYGVVNIPVTAKALNGGRAEKAPKFGTELSNDLDANHYVDRMGMYGGPCPPWNDERVHNYHFIVLALGKDAPIGAPASTKGDPAEAVSAKATFSRLIKSKALLGKAAVVGTYSLNANVTP